MKKLLITIAAAALVAVPLAAQAQDRDAWQGDGRDGQARSATGQGSDASARTDQRYDQRDNGARYGGYDRGRVDGGRAYYGYGGAGAGYGGYYPYAGYYPYGYRPGAYGAGYAYSYPDAYGTYQPFAYDYSAGDDAYYAGDPADGDDADSYQAAPNVGWSRGAGADCGQWVWRQSRGAYQWVPAPCR